MYILGISAFYHDSAAVLIEDGHIRSAAEEERFTRVKHDNSFPFNAIESCLDNADISINEVDYTAYYEKPLLKFERILDTFVRTYPLSLKPFLRGVPEWLTSKIKVEGIIRKKLGYKGKTFFIPHHLSHAAATFYPSLFKESAILTVDGIGEYQTTGLWTGEGVTITPLKAINFPHSLGLLYSTLTSFLGFRVNEDEYKVMGLAAYGKPSYADQVYKTVNVKNNGSFNLNMKFFSFRERFQMWTKEFEKLFGKPRLPDEPITEREKDIAASIQKVTEDIYLGMLNHLYKLTKCPNLCISGGVALNALANGKIYEITPFKRVYILGAAGDSGATLGAALFTHHGILNFKQRCSINNLCLGSSYDNEDVEQILKKYNVYYRKFGNETNLVKHTASLLADHNVIGWFQGRMEFGPRALGSRSILAYPSPASMKEKVNTIKVREQFRPFACSILEEKIHEYFNVPGPRHASPFMNFCFRIKRVKTAELAAVVHKDGTCRIQTVTKENGRYYKLIRKFYELTGTPCILNTSFNTKGEPIVESPEDAIKDFLKTELDYLVINNFIVSKPGSHGIRFF
ncbi:MAG: carbamoyltransferase [Patescibacteria group bacterium]|nr:carbamoyltransferase [Patescibacteria group bacterium]